jgi:hypothetical protein
MRAIAVETNDVGPARNLNNALIDFHYVTEADDGPARMTVDGRRYTMHAVSCGS